MNTGHRYTIVHKRESASLPSIAICG